ncbi:MAG: hypothetical protein ACM3VT_01665 [Solirubrobacterales bacterium]
MRHDGDHDVHGKKFRLKVRHVILGIFAALVFVGLVHMAILSSGANRRIEALRAAGQPTSLAELAVRNKLPMGMDNAAPLYESAFAAFVPPGEDVNMPFISRKPASLPRGTPISGPMAQVVADYLAANEKCLTLLHQASAIETCRYEYEYGKGSPKFDKVRSCAQLLKLAAVHHAGKGEAEAVMGCIQDSFCLGASLRKEPTLMPYLVSNGCSGLTVSALQYALSLTAFTDSQLKDLDEALVVAAGKIDLVNAMVTERCFMIDVIQNPSQNEATRPGSTVLKLPGIRSQGMIDVLDYMESCIQAAGLPIAQRMEKYNEIERRQQKLPAWHIISHLLTPALTRIATLDLRAQADLDLARIALAVERYRLAKGKLPEQLTDLVPAYLDEVPIDPLDGQPLRYRRTEPGYVVYSIGEDAKDNGGKERDQVAKGEPYDQCFIVTK